MAVRRWGLIAALAVAGCAAPLVPATISIVSPAPSVAAVGREPSVEPAKTASRLPAEVPKLIGLASRDVEGLLGQPRFVRRDGPAQIWQYGSDACTVNLFLYREGPAFKVRHVEYRNRNADLASSGGCDGPVVSMLQPKSP